jgi:hypothetical protein
MNKSVIYALIALILVSGSAFALKWGNGKLVTKNREVGDFTAISASNAAKVIVKSGESNTCRITLDSNLQKDFIAEVENGVLRLGFKSGAGILRFGKLEVTVTTPRLSGVKGSGASSFLIEDEFEDKEFKADLSGASKLQGRLNYEIVGIEASGASIVDVEGAFGAIAINISGSSHLNISGKAAAVIGEVSGSSRLSADDLVMAEADLQVSGASRVRLGEVSKSVSADLSGSSQMAYAGDAKVLKKSLSGSSRFRKID